MLSFYFASPFATTIIVLLCVILCSPFWEQPFCCCGWIFESNKIVFLCVIFLPLLENYMFCRCLWVFLCIIHFIAECKSVYETTNYCRVCTILFTLLWEQHPFAIMLKEQFLSIFERTTTILLLCAIRVAKICIMSICLVWAYAYLKNIYTCLYCMIILSFHC